MNARSLYAVSSLAAVLALGACHKKVAPPPAPAPAPAMAPPAPPPPPPPAPAPTETSSDEMARMRDAARASLTAPIYFDLDSDALSDADRASLDAKVGILNASSGVKIRVAGHTDERGSDEYNLALGQRRAAAAKRYLTQHGVPDAMIDIISYGEEHPAMDGHDEASWSKNRRDEFEITAGADALKPAAQ
ncbi:MAG: peptidoglycan-associated lipoprotein Pal [Gemmatimonadaceae bacterium]